MLGAAVALRQILLHILPGDPGYGSAIRVPPIRSLYTTRGKFG